MDFAGVAASPKQLATAHAATAVVKTVDEINLSGILLFQNIFPLRHDGLLLSVVAVVVKAVVIFELF